MSKLVSSKLVSSKLVSIIHHNDIIEIYWDSNVLVQYSGLWIILPNMTIRNVLYSIGFRNMIDVPYDVPYELPSNVLDMYVSCAPTNIIHITNQKLSGIFIKDEVDEVDKVDKVDEVDEDEVPSCFKSIINML